MAAYFILTQTVMDQTAYSEQYVPAVLPFLAKHGAEVLVAAFETEALQGGRSRLRERSRLPPPEGTPSSHHDERERRVGARVRVARQPGLMASPRPRASGSSPTVGRSRTTEP